MAGGDVDAQLVQLFPQQRLGDVLVVILVEDEADQVGPKWLPGMTSAGKGGDQVLAVGGQPAFAAVADDAGADDQILDDEVLVALEGGPGRRVDQRDDDLVGDGQLGGLGPLVGPGPLLAGSRGGRGGVSRRLGAIMGRVLRPLRRAISSSSSLDAVLLVADDIEQLPHQRGAFGFRDLGQRTMAWPNSTNCHAILPGVFEKLLPRWVCFVDLHCRSAIEQAAAGSRQSPVSVRGSRYRQRTSWPQPPHTRDPWCGRMPLLSIRHKVAVHSGLDGVMHNGVVRAPGHSPMADHRPFSSRSSLRDPHGAGLSPSLVMDIPRRRSPLGLPGPRGPCIPRTPPTRSLTSNQIPRGSSDGASAPANHAPTAASRYSNTDRPCCVHVAITVQIRSHQRFPALAPRPLRDQAVDHHEPDRLLRQVVRRLHPRRRDEPEITLPMLLEPLRQVATVAASPARRSCHIAAPRPAPPPAGSGTAGPSVAPGGGSPRRAPATPRADPRPIRPVPRVGQRRQELHIADQVGQTELERHAELAMVTPIGREVVAPQHPVELRRPGPRSTHRRCASGRS